jgi:glucose-1-phosphate thymidylyltransferase
MVRIGDKPVIAYVVERLRAAGCRAIRIMVRPEKADVLSYARAHRLEIVEGRPATLAASVRSAVTGVAADDIVALGLPDTIWQPADGFVPLVEAVRRGFSAALGLFEMSEPDRADVVSLLDDGRVARVDVRPVRPDSQLIWGCAAFRAASLHDLRTDQPLGSFWHELAQRERVAGVILSSVYVDIGTPSGLAEAMRRLPELAAARGRSGEEA